MALFDLVKTPEQRKKEEEEKKKKQQQKWSSSSNVKKAEPERSMMAVAAENYSKTPAGQKSVNTAYQKATQKSSSPSQAKKNFNSKNIALARRIGQFGLGGIRTTNRIGSSLDKNGIPSQWIQIDGFEPMGILDIQQGLATGTLAYSYDSGSDTYTFKKSTNQTPSSSSNQNEAQSKFQQDILKSGLGPMSQEAVYDKIARGEMDYIYDSDTDSYVLRETGKSGVPEVYSPFANEQSGLNTLNRYQEQSEKLVDELKDTRQKFWNEAYRTQGNKKTSLQERGNSFTPVIQALENTRNDFAEQKRQDKIASMEAVKNNPDFNDYVGQSKDNKIRRAKEIVNKYGPAIAPAFNGPLVQIKHAFATEEEEKIYSYYLAKEGKEKADEYLDAIDRRIDERFSKAGYEGLKEFSKDHPVAGTATNILSSLGQVGGLVETGKQNIQNMITGEYDSVNQYSPAMAANIVNEATREGVTGDISNPFLKFLAETGLSVGQFAGALATSAGNPVAAGAIMSSNAAGNTAYEAVQNGATADQALQLAAISGITEYALEKIPVETIFNTVKKGGKSGLTKMLLKSAAEEGKEELASQYINTIADNIIMTDQSQMSQYIDQLVKSGMSREEAEEQAKIEFWIKQPALAFVGGAIAGGTTAGAGVSFNSLIGKFNNMNTQSNLRDLPTAKEDIARESRNLEPLPRTAQEAAQINSGILSENQNVQTNNITENLQRASIPALNTSQIPQTTEMLGNSSELQNHVSKLKNYLTRYGIDDVKVDQQLTTGRVKAYFDPKDSTIHLSPMLDTKEVINKKVAHELIHPAKKGDSQFVNEVVSVMRDMGRDVASEIAEHKKRYTDFFINERQYTPQEAAEKVTDQYAAEETAGDFLGELFENEELQNTLASKNPNFVQRIISAIKNLVNRLRGQKQNSSQITQYQKLAEDLRAAVQRQTGVKISDSNPMQGDSSEARYSIEYNNAGEPELVVINEDIFKGHEGEKPHKVIRDYLRNHIGEYATIIESGQKVYFGKDLPNEYTQSKYTKQVSPHIRNAKNQASQNLDELIEISTKRRWEKAKHAEKHKEDAKYGFYKYTTRFKIGEQIYNADILIRNAADEKKYLYDVINIKKETAAQRGEQTPYLRTANTSRTDRSGTSDFNNTSISHNDTSVNSSIRANQRDDTRLSVDSMDSDAGYLDSVMQQADTLDDNDRTIPTKAVQSKKDLQNKLISDFSIPEGSRKTVRDAVEQFAKTLQRGEAIKISDVSKLFQTLYESGRVEAMDSVSEDMKQIRQWFNGSKLFVPESVKAEFGDDWKSFRSSALGNKIVLTGDQNARGIDSAFEEAREIFGNHIFKDNETDLTEMLRTIVRSVQEGKTKFVSLADSLAEYGDKAVKENYNSLLDSFTNDMKTYIEKSNLEMSLKEKGIKEVNQLKDHYRDIRAKQAQRRKESDLRNKTMNGIKWLSKNYKKQTPEYKAKIDEVVGDISSVARSMTGNTKFELEDLNRFVADMEKNENFIPSHRLQQKLAELDKLHLDDLNLNEVKLLHDMVFGLKHELQNRNREIGVEKAREITDISHRLQTELKELQQEKGHNKYKKYIYKDGLSPFRALRMFDGFRSDGELTKAAKSFEQGEYKMIDYQTKADKIFEPFMKDKRNLEWLKTAAGKNAEFIDKKIRPVKGIDENGKTIFGEEQTISITPMMRVQMYLDLQNQDNIRHIVNGGYKIAKKDGYNKNNQEYNRPVRMSVSDIKSIVSEMPEAEKRYASLLKEYYNTFSKERINQTSMELDGYERAMEDNYSPIVTDPNYNISNAAINDGTIEGLGSLKERMHASNPIILGDADAVYRRHRDNIARYYGMAIPIRNFEMVLNTTNKGFDGSLKEEMEQAWGKEGKQYLDDLLVELNGMRPREKDIRLFDTLTGNYTNAILSFNPSSTLKQLSAYPSSAAVVGWDALGEGLKLWKKVDTDLVSKYTPLLDWRAQGYSTQELADYTRSRGSLPKSRLGKTLSGINWLQAADQAVIKRLWAAAEYRVRKDTDLRPGKNPMDGNDPFYKAVADVFNDTVSKTQSMATMMHRANLSKTKTGRLITYMKGDAIQKGGYLFEKIGEMERTHQEYKQKPTATNKRAAANAKKNLVRAASSFVADAAIVSLITYAMTREKDRWRDEEGNLTLKSVTKELVKETGSNLSSMVVFGDNLYDMIDAAFFGGDWYDIQIPGLEAGSKIVQGLINTAQTSSDFIDGLSDVIANGGSVPKYIKDEGSDTLGLLKDTAIGIGTLLGIPASNMEKYTLKALYAASPELAAQYENVFNRTNKSDLKGLYGKKLEARIGTAISNRIKDVETSTKKEISRLYQTEGGDVIPVEVPKKISVNGEEVTLTPYKRQVYEDTFDLTVGNSLDKLVQSDYYNSLDDRNRIKVIKYLYDYADAVAKEKSAGRELSGWVANAKFMEDDGLDINKYLQYKMETDEYTSENGNVKTQKIEYLKNSGFTQKEQSTIYFDDIASEKELERYINLSDSYGLTGNDYYDFISGTNGMEPEKDSNGKSISGTLDMKYMAYISRMNINEEQKVQLFLSSANSESLVKNFNSKVDEAKKQGINELDLAQFYCISYATSADKDKNGESITGSKQNKIWAYIDSLNLTNAQKDYLHLCSYSAKTLNKAPWNSGNDLSGYMPNFSYINGIGGKTIKKATTSKSSLPFPELKSIAPKASKTNYSQKGSNALSLTRGSKTEYLPRGSAKLNSLKEQEEEEKRQKIGFLPTAKEDIANGIIRFG